MEAIMSIVEKSAEQFVQFYYGNFDGQRTTLPNLYRDKSTILWNGNALSGAQKFSELLAVIPQSIHEIDVYNCQPITATVNAQGTCGILINVTGSVKFDDGSAIKSFSEVFMLMPDEEQTNNYFVQSQNFRCSRSEACDAFYGCRRLEDLRRNLTTHPLGVHKVVVDRFLLTAYSVVSPESATVRSRLELALSSNPLQSEATTSTAGVE
ncbi:hypothetical protein J3Q64DRAFT_1821272 [Phycomyces blakesleeanus]|uniref:NTF2 domain-containing protein n=1 Tax=Phycomyces blakesleeanus TaxID=4837 RepID=A0ABR3B2B8_PHYBL